MIVGVLKETKEEENRMALTPAGVAEAFSMTCVPVEETLP